MPIFALLLLLTGLGVQDPAAELADRLQVAPAESRAALLGDERRSPALPAALRLLNDRALARMQVGAFDEAVRLSRLVIDAADVLGEPALKATPYHRLGQTLRRMDRHAEAVEAFDAALPLALAAGNVPQQAQAFMLRADSLRVLGRLDEALVSAERAVTLFLSADLQPDAALALNSLGTTSRVQGDLARALRYLTRSLAVAEAAGARTEMNVALQSISDVYNSQSDYPLALAHLARVRYRPAKTVTDHRRVSAHYGRLGLLYSRTGHAHARALLMRSREEAVQGLDLGQEAWATAALAEHDLRTHAPGVEAGFREAAGLYGRVGNRMMQGTLHTMLAAALTAAGRPGEALEEARRGADLARETGAVRQELNALDEQGRALRSLHRPREAADVFAEAVRRADDVFAHTVRGADSGAKFFEAYAPTYTALMDLRLAEGAVLEGLGLTEQVRGRWLLDALRLGNVTTPERTVVPQLTDETLLALVPDTRTVLVQFAFAETGAWVFTVIRSSAGTVDVQASRLAVTAASLAPRVERFRQAIGARDLGYGPQARALYDDLLGGIRGRLAGRTHMVLLPDGVLWTLPFQALQGPDGRHLIEHAAISYAPSLTALGESVRSARPVRNRAVPLLAMAAHARALPNTAAEVRQLRALYGPGAVAATGSTALASVWRAAPDGYRVVHLATHGVLDPVHPLASYLELSPDGRGNDGRLTARDILVDRLRADLVVLSACETGRGDVVGGEGLVGLSWAVLMAGTPTAVVSQWKVDSASTTRLMVAFHQGLARHVRRAGPLHGKARALRAAQVALMQTPAYRHPFYWAPFVMVGDGY